MAEGYNIIIKEVPIVQKCQQQLQIKKDKSYI